MRRPYAYVGRVPLVYVAAREIRSPDLRVLVGLLRRASIAGGGSFTARLDDLQRDTGKARSTVKRAVDRLEALGVLEVLRRGRNNRRSKYRFPERYPLFLEAARASWTTQDGREHFVPHVELPYLASPEITDAEFRVLLVHLRHRAMSERGYYELSLLRVKKETGLGPALPRRGGEPDVELVRRATRSLREKKLIELIARGGGSKTSFWRVPVPPGWLELASDRFVRSVANEDAASSGLMLKKSDRDTTVEAVLHWPRYLEVDYFRYEMTVDDGAPKCGAFLAGSSPRVYAFDVDQSSPSTEPREVEIKFVACRAGPRRDGRIVARKTDERTGLGWLWAILTDDLERRDGAKRPKPIRRGTVSARRVGFVGHRLALELALCDCVEYLNRLRTRARWMHRQLEDANES